MGLGRHDATGEPHLSTDHRLTSKKTPYLFKNINVLISVDAA